MTRKLIAFTDRQVAFLKREAKRLGITFTEALRRIIDAKIEETKK